MKRALPLLLLVLTACGSKSIEGVQTFTYAGGDHRSGSLVYAENPPAGGPHNPSWLNCGIYEEAVPAEYAVHSLEHGAVWHEAGGWAMRQVLGEPKAIVPSAKAVAGVGYRLMVPLHHIHAAYVRSHFNSMEVGLQDGPRPNEILFALVMGTGPRVHARLGGLTKEQVSVHDGQR